MTDFDFQIDGFQLIHKNSLIRNFRWTAYRTGRGADGLIFCVSGDAVYRFEEETFHLQKGQMLFLPADCAYTLRCESVEPFVHFTVNFMLSDLAAAPDSDAARILTGQVRHFTDAASSQLYEEHFERLLSVWQGKRSGWQLMAKSILYELLYLYLSDAGIHHRREDVSARLHPATAALDGTDSHRYSVPDLAELCGMSETHFRRLFRQQFGLSPAQYRLKRKMERAKDLLISGQYNVAEAAKMTGFSDTTYFSKIFRRYTGFSPRDFKEGS